MWHKVKDLSPDQRLAIEGLIGRRLADDEGVNSQPSRVLKDAPTGDERSRAYNEYLRNADTLSRRADNVPDEEIEALIDEACDRARHSQP